MLFSKQKKDTLKIVIVGHVDHGKSTLIGRLLYDTHSLPYEKIKEVEKISKEFGKEIELAYVMDHLKEERERNITIDSAHIYFESKKRKYVIIDAPGHFEFTKNMLTGASQAQAAILIIDAHEGIQEQTKRHAYLLKMLGLENVIVILNKMDLVKYDQEPFDKIKQSASAFLNDLKLTPRYFIPVAAQIGTNISKKSNHMPWYKGPCLLNALDSLIHKDLSENQPLRFPVQDVYEIDGEQIIVGKVASGHIRTNESVMILPSSTQVKIKDIRSYPKTHVQTAEREENIGIVVNNTDAKISRGNVLVSEDASPSVNQSFHGNLFWMSKNPLTKNDQVIFRSTTQKVKATIEKIETRINASTFETLEEDAEQLLTNEAAIIHFKTEQPVVLDKFNDIEETGRFVIEQGYDLQGAGIIK